VDGTKTESEQKGKIGIEVWEGGWGEERKGKRGGNGDMTEKKGKKILKIVLPRVKGTENSPQGGKKKEVYSQNEPGTVHEKPRTQGGGVGDN